MIRKTRNPDCSHARSVMGMAPSTVMSVLRALAPDYGLNAGVPFFMRTYLKRFDFPQDIKLVYWQEKSAYRS
ncbi:MAG TPA: hypothetical protein PKL83_01890 [bacterium]|nr:hypothetical protein [bacterium]